MAAPSVRPPSLRPRRDDDEEAASEGWSFRWRSADGAEPPGARAAQRLLATGARRRGQGLVGRDRIGAGRRSAGEETASRAGAPADCPSPRSRGARRPTPTEAVAVAGSRTEHHARPPRGRARLHLRPRASPYGQRCRARLGMGRGLRRLLAALLAADGLALHPLRPRRRLPVVSRRTPETRRRPRVLAEPRDPTPRRVDRRPTGDGDSKWLGKPKGRDADEEAERARRNRVSRGSALPRGRPPSRRQVRGDLGERQHVQGARALRVRGAHRRAHRRRGHTIRLLAFASRAGCAARRVSPTRRASR